MALLTAIGVLASTSPGGGWAQGLEPPARGTPAAAAPGTESAGEVSGGTRLEFEAPEAYIQSAADGSALMRLATAREALANLSSAEDPAERRLAYDTALEALTALYQLHGCAWARPRLEALYREPGCPDVHTGFSRDGRLYLRVDRMELRNPAYAGYTAYLCTLGSLTPLTLGSAALPGLDVRLVDGRVLPAEQIAPGHPLWPNLQKLAETCVPPARLESGRAWAFKQFIAVAGLLPGQVQAVSLKWGEYALTVPYYASEVQGG